MHQEWILAMVARVLHGIVKVQNVEILVLEKLSTLYIEFILNFSLIMSQNMESSGRCFCGFQDLMFALNKMNIDVQELLKLGFYEFEVVDYQVSKLKEPQDFEKTLKHQCILPCLVPSLEPKSFPSHIPSFCPPFPPAHVVRSTLVPRMIPSSVTKCRLLPEQNFQAQDSLRKLASLNPEKFGTVICTHLKFDQFWKREIVIE